MDSGMEGRAIRARRRETTAGRPAPRPSSFEAADRFLLRVVRLEASAPFGDGQQILNPIGQVEQRQRAPLAADGSGGPLDFAEARAVAVGRPFEIEQQLLTGLLDERID